MALSGYEIWVYDLEGNVIRIIRKEHKPVQVTEEINEMDMRRL